MGSSEKQWKCSSWTRKSRFRRLVPVGVDGEGDDRQTIIDLLREYQIG